MLPPVHNEHMLEPADAEKEPDEQGVHTVELPKPYVPAGHGVQPLELELGTQYVPFPQQTAVPLGVVHWL